MAASRVLPIQRNPLVANPPSHEILVARRRLGQTRLVLHGALDSFDYAHLRMPLPKDLTGSGLFRLSKVGVYPESYFLMRRSDDGYVSATGMFKAAFPWASTAQDEAERMYHYKLPSGGPEVAGSVWISPEEALKLADEYGMRPWIVAMLDPEPIEKSTKDRQTAIKTPPRFDSVAKSPPKASPRRAKTPTAADGHARANTKAAQTVPQTASVRNTRSRATRSVSPSKAAAAAATPRKTAAATPRKPRTTRRTRAGTAALADEAAAANASSSAKLAADSADGGAEDQAAQQQLVDSVAAPPGISVNVSESVEQAGADTLRSASIRVEFPTSARPVLPESPQDMLATARDMVAQAAQLDAAAGATRAPKAKRKADDMDVDDADALPAAKKLKKLEVEIQTERVAQRALISSLAAAAIGTAVFIFGST